MTRRPQLELGDYLPYLINRVGSALVASFSRDELVRQHLNIAEWRVLAALSNDGGQRQIDLAATISIDASTLSRLVTRLIRMGLVTRSRSTTSSREVLVALSPKGRKLVKRLIPVAKRLEQAATAGLPAQDLAVVKRALRRMYRNMAGG